MSEKTIELSGSDTSIGQIHVKLDMVLPHKQAMAVLEIVRDHQLAEQHTAELEAKRAEAVARKAESAARKAAKAEAAKARRGKGGGTVASEKARQAE